MMSTREKLESRVERLTEKQLEVLIAFLDMTFPEQADKNDDDEIEALCGIFHDVANPDLIPYENENAWAEAAAERERRILEEMNSEDS